MSLKGVIFDWDGVVINSASLHEESWKLLAGELNLELPPGHFKRGFGKRNEIIIPEILEWTKTPELIKKWGNRKEELYREIGKEKGISLLHGIIPFLESLDKESIPCVIGTSTQRKNLELAFSQLKISHFFTDAVCSEDVVVGKPNPEVFVKAALKIKQKPEDCVVLEDSKHGIEAAKKGGMKAIGLATTRPSDQLFEHGADIVVSSPADLNISLLHDLFIN